MRGNTRRKGYYFTMDAIMAALLLITGLLLLSRFYVQDVSTEQVDVLSNDLLNSLNEIDVDEMYDPFIKSEVNNGNITDLNKSILLMIGEYWATNQTEKAINLSRILIEDVVPENYGVNITLGDDIIYSRERQFYTDQQPQDVISSKRMISGIAKGFPLKGSSSAAYLKRIRDKRTASYIYFGGFEGQGNITKYIDDIPTDVSSSDILEILLELDVTKEFDMFINDVFCDTFTPSSGLMEADVFNATHCNSSIVTGRNTFDFEFEGLLNSSFIAGGYIKVRYLTDQFQKNVSYGIWQYQFPGIVGIINLYSYRIHYLGNLFLSEALES